MLPNRFHKADLAQKGNENRDPSKRGHGALRLAQDQPLIRQQGGDLARNWFVRRVWFHSPVVSNPWPQSYIELRFFGLVLEGEQGIGKSTAVSILAGAQWFTDQVADFGSKDASMQLRGMWIIELGELGSLTRSDRERVKAFISQQRQTFRLPY